MSVPEPLPYRDVFEKHGETGTRFKFASRTDDVGAAARVWLFEVEAARAEAASARRDAREEETLRISRRANRLSTIAISLSAIAIACSIAAAFIERGSLFPEGGPQQAVQRDGPEKAGAAR